MASHRISSKKADNPGYRNGNACFMAMNSVIHIETLQSYTIPPFLFHRLCKR